VCLSVLRLHLPLLQLHHPLLLPPKMLQSEGPTWTCWN